MLKLQRDVGIMRRRKCCRTWEMNGKTLSVTKEDMIIPRRSHRVNNICGIKGYMMWRARVNELVLRLLGRNRDRWGICSRWRRWRWGMSNICMRWNRWHRMKRRRLWWMRTWRERGSWKLSALKVRWMGGIKVLLRRCRSKSIWWSHIVGVKAKITNSSGVAILGANLALNVATTRAPTPTTTTGSTALIITSPCRGRMGKARMGFNHRLNLLFPN